MNAPSLNGWHLDKKVPIALIFAIFLQSFAAIWWASAVTARLDRVEQTVGLSQGRESRIVRLETQVQGIRESLVDIKDTLSEMNRKLDRSFSQ